MATTQNTFTGNGSNLGPFSFTFKWLESTDIKVTVGGVLKTAGTHYNLQSLNYTTKTGGQVLFTAGNAPANGASIRIYRDTDDEALSAVFSSGSAIRAKDLNDNFTQNLYVTQETNNNSLNVDGSNPMVGPLNMNGFQITNLPVPAVDTNAATKKYVDDRYGVTSIPGYTRWRKVATASQTTFSGTGDYGGVLSYSATREQVYINGALQQRVVDYTADNGTSVVFNVGLTVGDIVDIICVNNIANSSISNAGNITYNGQFTGQTSRTVAAKLADIISVKDFGATGDGTTDDTSAFQSCATHATTLSKGLNRPVGVYVPSGTYRINQQIVFDVAPQNETVRGIVLFGDGRESSRLVATSGNTTGLIKFTGNGNTEIWSISDLSFLSPLSANDGTNNGTAIYVESTVTEGDPGFGSHRYRSVSVERVTIGAFATTVTGNNDGSVGRWFRGIDVRNKWFPIFKDVLFFGAGASSVANINAGIFCRYCYSPEIINCYFEGYMQNGAWLDCNTQEDFRFESCFFVNQDNGIYITRPSTYDNILYEPGGSITNSHMACRVNNVYIERHRQVNIIGNYMYMPTATTGLPSCIRLNRTADILIANNQFLEPGFYTNDSNATCGVRMSGAAQGILIHGCHFNHGGISVYVDSGTNGGNFGDNTVLLTNCSSKGQSIWGGPTKRIVDNTGIVSCNGWWDPNEGTTNYTLDFFYGGTGGGAAEEEVSLYSRADYASNSTGKLLEKRIKGLLSNGTEAEITRQFAFANNSSSTPTMKEGVFHTTVNGITQLGGWEWSSTQDTTPFLLIHKFGPNNGDYTLKRVLVGAADSAGTGFRTLRVVN
jgi:hypothetical protein